MYCKNCGHEVSETDIFCVNCGTPVTKPAAPPVQPAQPPVQQAAPAAPPPIQPTVSQNQTPPPPMAAPGQAPAASGQPAAVADKGVYGRFGGLMIYGGLIIALLIAGAISSGMYLSGINIKNIMIQLLTLLPLAFAVGLTVKAKGVDISLAAMVTLTTGIMLSMDNLGLAILIAVIACIIVGTINAVGIHFIKLPGILVTIVTYMIIGYIASLLIRNGAMRQLNIERSLMYIAPLIAAIVAAAAALLSSIGKNHRNKFWPTLIVYAASGILAVLYCVTLFARVQAVVYGAGSNLVTVILFIALFLGITRLFKSKAMGVVFAIVPALAYTVLRNLLNILNVDPYIQQVVQLVVVLILIFLVFYRGRAQIIGQSLDKQYRAKSWIAMIPLFVILLSGILLAIVLSVTIGRPSQMYFALAGRTSDIIMFLIAIGMSVAYGLMKPKGSTII